MIKLYIGYLILSSLLLLFLSQKKWKVFLFKLTILTFLPIIGLLFPSIWPKRWIKNNEHFFPTYLDSQTSDIPNNPLKTLQKIERSEELNVFSVEEALLISDYSTRRKVLIDLLKHDVMQYIDLLKTAVINDDTETSHYAVSALVEVKRELSILLQKLAVEFSQNPHDETTAKAYAEVIQEYLRSGYLDEQASRQYKVTFVQVIEQLIINNQANEQHYHDKIMMELEMNDLAAAEHTATILKQQFPLSEQAYLSTMAIYFQARAFDKLTREVQLLINSPITLSNKALTVVRYWTGVTTIDKINS